MTKESAIYVVARIELANEAKKIREIELSELNSDFNEAIGKCGKFLTFAMPHSNPKIDVLAKLFIAFASNPISVSTCKAARKRNDLIVPGGGNGIRHVQDLLLVPCAANGAFLKIIEPVYLVCLAILQANL